MSRFYNTLKAAKLSAPVESGQEQATAWAALDIDELTAAATPAAVASLEPEPIVVEAEPAGFAPIPEASEADVPTGGSLGILTKVSLDPRARLIPHGVDAIVVEHYRRLRTKLLQQQEEKAFRSVVITSSSPQEGKTVTSMNLGLSFAMLPSFRVLLVDGDLRVGSLGRWLGVEDSKLPGLSNVIDGSAKLEEAVFKAEGMPLHFMLRGTSQAPPAELLNSAQFKRQMQRMSEEFDLVIVDSPPVNLITDVQLLAAGCDAVLMIARAYSTTKRAFEQAVQDLSTFRVLGTVLNGGTERQLYGRYRGYY